MFSTVRSHIAYPVLAVAAALASACANDTPVSPLLGAGPAVPRAAATMASTTREPDLTGCETLAAPAGSKAVAHLYATGVQIYRWNGTAWQFEGPSASLYSDAAGSDQVGTHSAGPRWDSNDGSTVRGSAPLPCVADPNAIPWLRLTGTPGATPGIFRRATTIQRVNTTGGKAPAVAGTTAGEVAEVPYTAEYYFYRAQ